ncbi:MAG: GatB/YqeY domain-containing protein [Microscillaceae bacterium]
MSLKSKIENDLKEAMRAKDKDRLRALRAIKSLILLEETKEGGTGHISEEEEIKMLRKAVKQRRDSAEIYQSQNRTDLAEVELAELAIIETYLPRQLSEAELESEVRAIVAETGAKGPSDMGKVMGVASKQLAGQADGKAISAMVKTILSNL